MTKFCKKSIVTSLAKLNSYTLFTIYFRLCEQPPHMAILAVRLAITKTRALISQYWRHCATMYIIVGSLMIQIGGFLAAQLAQWSRILRKNTERKALFYLVCSCMNIFSNIRPCMELFSPVSLLKCLVLHGSLFGLAKGSEKRG